MIETPMDVLKNFPVRKNKKQKQAFRDAVQSYAQGLGYTVTVEKGSMGSKNVVIGNPAQAKYLLTAHYDTPAAMILPNLITPCNPVTFIAYQILVVGLLMVVSIGAGVAVGVAADDPALAGSFGMLVYWILLLMMLLGPANKNNANDNTSGVVTVLETARALPEHLREQVCFVLFDLEEAGLVGSSSYAKKHRKAAKYQIVLNCDCCGDGDELVLFPMKKIKKDGAKMDAFRAVCIKDGEKSLTIREKGFAYYPSDQNKFPYGVGIAALNKGKLGLYMSRIHTKKDVCLEQTNVNILRSAIVTYISCTK